MPKPRVSHRELARLRRERLIERARAKLDQSITVRLGRAVAAESKATHELTREDVRVLSEARRRGELFSQVVGR